jgi:hypothetical protein
MATERPAAIADDLTASAAVARVAGDPWEKFSRATSIPTATSSEVQSRLAGPIVHTSFVRRGAMVGSTAEDRSTVGL